MQRRLQNIIIIRSQATAGQYSVVVACQVVWKLIPAAKGQWPSHTAIVCDLYQIGGEKMSTFITINMIIRQRIRYKQSQSLFIMCIGSIRLRYIILFISQTLIIITLINFVLWMY